MKNGPSHSTALLVCATAPFVKGASCCSGISLVPSTRLSSSLSHFPVHPSFCGLPLSFNHLTSLSSVPSHYFLYSCHLFNIFLFFFFILFTFLGAPFLFPHSSPPSVCKCSAHSSFISPLLLLLFVPWLSLFLRPLPLFAFLSNLLTRVVVLRCVLWSWWVGCMVYRAAVRW